MRKTYGIRPDQIPRSRRPIPKDIALRNVVMKETVSNPVMEYVDSLSPIEKWHANYDFLPWIDTPDNMVCVAYAHGDYWLSAYYRMPGGEFFLAKLMDRAAPEPPTLTAHKQPMPWAGIPKTAYSNS